MWKEQKGLKDGVLIGSLRSDPGNATEGRFRPEVFIPGQPILMSIRAAQAFKLAGVIGREYEME